MSNQSPLDIAIKALYNSRRHMEITLPKGYQFSGNWQIVNQAILKIEKILKEEQAINETVSDNTKN